MARYEEENPRHFSALTKTLIAGATLLAVILFVWIVLLRSAKPDAGHEIVLVDKPLIFGHGGVQHEPVRTGQTYVWFSTQRIDVNVQPQQYEVKFDDLMSSDGVPLDFDSVIRLQVTDSVTLIEDFGPGWYHNNVESEYKNRVRQAVRKHGMNETAIDTTAVEAIDDEVSKAMTEYIESAKLPLRLIQVTVGKANPPDSIKSQRVETAAQQQRIRTEQQRKLAEDSRKEAELSRADADNAYRNAMGLSPDLFVSLEAVKMQRDVCGASGAHCTFIVGATGGVAPVINATTASPPAKFLPAE